MRYEFRLLGPVELDYRGSPASLGPPKRRGLVTALLLEANRPVPLSRLLAAMWAGPAPRSAVANLRTHASALRRLLDERLVARPRAYELRVGESELDAAEFARLARAGRHALTAGDPATALARLGAGLSLWRGPAGDGVPAGTSLDAPLSALNEQRLDAFEDYLEARLHTRSYPEIAADLRRHLAVWPGRERSWALLMRTLYHSGNVAAALATYTEARDQLRAQLGIEPGPELRALQRAVLNREVTWDPPGAVGTGAVAPAAGDVPARVRSGTRPRESPAHGGSPGRPRPALAPQALPPEPELLLGRDPELAATLAALHSGTRAVVVQGRAGAGKTTLALRAAHRAAGAFPDGQVSIELSPHERLPVGAVVGAVLRALGMRTDQVPHAFAERLATYRSLVGDRRVLLVLEGVSDEGQVRPLLAGEMGAAVLATSRRRLSTLSSARYVELGPLPEVSAVEVLAAYAGRGPVEDEPAAVRALVRLCEGLPLALRVVGERLSRRPRVPPGLLATHLASRPLAGLRRGDLSVADALAADLRAVTEVEPIAARVLPLLGQQSAGSTVTAEDLAGKLEEPPSKVFYALEQLVDGWLVEAPRPGHYRTAGLAHEYAEELAAAISLGACSDGSRS